jgi:rhomboid protease GluP
VVTVLLTVQLLAFVLLTLMGGSTNPQVLLRFGALESTLLQAGEWWRLILPLFLHVGLMHLLVNGFMLYLLGPQLEWLYGRRNFLLLFFMTGIMGNLVLSWLSDTFFTAGSDASIYGLFGVYLYLFLFRKGAIDPETGTGIFIFVGLNILFNLVFSQSNFIADLGGLASGMMMAGPLLRIRKQKQR